MLKSFHEILGVRQTFVVFKQKKIWEIVDEKFGSVVDSMRNW